MVLDLLLWIRLLLLPGPGIVYSGLGTHYWRHLHKLSNLRMGIFFCQVTILLSLSNPPSSIQHELKPEEIEQLKVSGICQSSCLLSSVQVALHSYKCRCAFPFGNQFQGVSWAERWIFMKHSAKMGNAEAELSQPKILGLFYSVSL